MLQEVVEDSLHALMVNVFLACITAMALLTVLMAVTKSIAVSIISISSNQTMGLLSHPSNIIKSVPTKNRGKVDAIHALGQDQ